MRIVLEAQVHGRTARSESGMTGREADALARDVIISAGYGQASPTASATASAWKCTSRRGCRNRAATTRCGPGMVFSVSQASICPGWGGVRIEDLVVLEDDGARVLCHSPKDSFSNRNIGILSTAEAIRDLDQ